jgi:Zn-dependent peptidase ImmA (M78 family)
MLAEITVEDFAAALDSVASELLAAGAVTKPPVDAKWLAGELGIAVCWDDAQASRARIVAPAEAGYAPPAILLRHDVRPEREQWAIAHEIGEATAYRVFAALGVDPREAPPAAREEVANRLAGRLLLPTMWFARRGRTTDWNLPCIKEAFATASHELIARRMLELPPPVIVTVFDQGRLSWRRSNVVGRVPPISDDERAAQRLAHELGDAATIDSRSGRVQAWPVHEPDWKREILRREVGLEE